MKKSKFLRTGTRRFKRLGKGRKRLQKWRRARGRDSKIREKRKGRPRKVVIGYRSKKSERRRIKGKIPVFVANLKQAEKTEKGEIIIIAKIGRKKRKEIENKIQEKGGIILNLKPKKNESTK